MIVEYARDSAHRGLQPTTIEMRTVRLRCFAAWADKPWHDVTADDIERFLASRTGVDAAALGSRTRYCWISHLGCFFHWAIRKGFLEHNPTLSMDRPRLARLLPRPIDQDDLARAIDAADSTLAAMLIFASHMGLRCCEISRLHTNDILATVEPAMVLVHGKGGKDRTVPLHPRAQAALAWLPKRGWLFRRPDGRQLTPAEVSIAIRGHLRAHDVDATAHQLRHWFGTALYRATQDLRLVQELMGHSNPATTASYAAWAARDAASAVGKIGL